MKVTSWLGDWMRSCPNLQTEGGSKDIAYFIWKVEDDCVFWEGGHGIRGMEKVPKLDALRPWAKLSGSTELGWTRKIGMKLIRRVG